MMSSIGSISGTPPSYLPPAAGTARRSGDSDDGVGQSNFMNAIASTGTPGAPNVANSLQTLLQQRSSDNVASMGPLDARNSSFQNLIGGAQNDPNGAQNPAAPTLQSFLQNLMQSMGNGRNISGALVNTTA